MIDACIVITTCGSEAVALNIAAALVDQRLAACVSIRPGIKSYYSFDDGTHMDEEVELVIKTRAGMFDKASALIKELHTYDVPEIMMFRLDSASEPFLKWIEGTVDLG
jgi:periplasmic divalent cation tolerance protein